MDELIKDAVQFIGPLVLVEDVVVSPPAYPNGFFEPSGGSVRFSVDNFGIVPIDVVIGGGDMICDGRLVLNCYGGFAG